MSSMELWVKSVSLPISWSRFRGLGGGEVEGEQSARVKRRGRGQRSLEEEKKENESGINNL